MSQDPPYPKVGEYLKSIRSSSRLVREGSQITIAEDSIKRLLTCPAFQTTYERVSVSHGLAMPLKFPSILSELNLISILSMLNFASGYRVPLHAQTGRGAWDNIRALVFSMFITSSIGEGDLLSAKGMTTVTVPKIAELMGVSVHEEKPHESIPGVTVGTVGGVIHELVSRITDTLNETGKILSQSGYQDLGSFVLEALKEAENQSRLGSLDGVEVIIDRLVRAIPAFRDMAYIDQQPVYCFKKALFLVHAIRVRFGSINPPPFPVPNTDHLPIFSDNVIPSMLVHLGVLDLRSASNSLSSIFPEAGSSAVLDPLLALPLPASEVVAEITKQLPKEGPILSSEQAYVLRAAAIDACEMIVQVARSVDVSSDQERLAWINEMKLPDLDGWLWSVAKDRPDYRSLERFVQQDTIFY